MKNSEADDRLAAPNTLSTPEGDNEFAPEEPLSPVSLNASQIPPGFNQHDRTQAYKQDKPLKKYAQRSRNPKA